MQRTTRAVGRLLVSRPQDPITPRAQTIRYVAIFGLAIILFILASYTYAWYHGPWVLMAIFVASTALPSIIGLRPGSPRRRLRMKREANLAPNRLLEVTAQPLAALWRTH